MSDLEVIRQHPYNAETPLAALAHPTTPSANVYVRSNFEVPLLGDGHRIEVDGAVAHRFAIDIAELRSLPQHTVGITMECAGNDRLGMRPIPAGEPWMHGAVSTATWTGVPLALLLDRAGIAPGAVEVEVAGADAGPRDDADGIVRFARGVQISDAMQPDTLLALAMNGAPLTAAHGAPVRLVVPGWYGMTNVKWVSRISVRETPFDGYFQTKRYVYDEHDRPECITPVARMRVKSLITSPTDAMRCGRSFTVHGWAWSGHGAITRVELAVDGGETWRDAQLGRPESAHAWTPWRCDVTLDSGGRITLRSRATDAGGNTQPAAIRWNRLGYGNNAVRAIVVEVD